MSRDYTLEIGASNPILRTKSKPVQLFNKNIINLGKDLVKLMDEREGAGLSAPQIGENMRIIAAGQRKIKGKSMKHLGTTIMINPSIISHGTQMNRYEEGCLSLPNTRINIERYTQITVSFFTPEGKPETHNYTSFDARVIQHEIDHLEGILIVDKG